MDQDIKNLVNSMSEDQKEDFLQNQGIIKKESLIDSETGEVIEESTSYKTRAKRKPNSFALTSMTEMKRLAKQSPKSAYNVMLVYVLDNMNLNNEITFGNDIREYYDKKGDTRKFYRDRSYLIKEKYLFETDRPNMYTLNANLIMPRNIDKYNELLIEQGLIEDTTYYLKLIKQLKRQASIVSEEDRKNIVEECRKIIEIFDN